MSKSHVRFVDMYRNAFDLLYNKCAGKGSFTYMEGDLYFFPSKSA